MRLTFFSPKNINFTKTTTPQKKNLKRKLYPFFSHETPQTFLSENSIHPFCISKDERILIQKQLAHPKREIFDKLQTNAVHWMDTDTYRKFCESSYYVQARKELAYYSSFSIFEKEKGPEEILLPRVVVQCVEYIRDNCLEVEGLMGFFSFS